MKRAIRGLAALALLLLGGVGQAQGGSIITHQGATNPATENFGLWPYNGGIATAPITNDNGYAAWQITNSGNSNQQAFYNQLGGTGPFDQGGSGLTAAQINDINANGFIMSLRARIVQGPAYDPSGTQKISTDIAVAGFNGSRFDIGLGSDGLGNTLVVLPKSISFNGDVFSFAPFGSPLLISGADYHLYQLSYNPGTGTASLFVDGVEKETGYAGSTVTGGATANNFGLTFGSTDNATSNFALAELQSGQLTSAVPEPSSLALLGVVAAALTGHGWRRRHGHPTRTKGVWQMKRAILMLAALALPLVEAGHAEAGPVSAVNFTGGVTVPTGGNLSAGWSFTTNQSITIDALADAFPLITGSNVRLYDGRGSVFATATVLPSDPTDGTFNFHSITPVTLPAHGTFFVAADTPLGQSTTILVTGLTTDPAINYVGEVESAALGTNPTTDLQNGANNPGYFGPSFEISRTSAVPEPSTLALAGVVVAGAIGHGWRRRRSLSECPAHRRHDPRGGVSRPPIHWTSAGSLLGFVATGIETGN